MGGKFFATLAMCGVTACTTTRGPVTSWGKEGVSLLDYQADGIYCAAVTENMQGGNGANTAGGINGRNSSGNNLPGVDTSKSSSAATPVGGGGVYRESASDDFVNRAAMQQRHAEMQRLKARQDAMRSCLVNRGYTEFRLTDEQRQQLSKLPEGSAERRAYLYELGTDPAVLEAGKVR